MNNVHEDEPVVFQSRWALCYLRGPISREQISLLMVDKKLIPTSNGPAVTSLAVDSRVGAQPVLAPGIRETFVTRQGSLLGNATLRYRPGLLATARLRFHQASIGIDELEDRTIVLPVVEEVCLTVWDQASISAASEPDQENHPEEGGVFGSLPAELNRVKTFLTYNWRSRIISIERKSCDCRTAPN